MLKIVAGQYVVDEDFGCLDHLEQIGTGDVSVNLFNLVKNSTCGCIRALSIHALLSWIQRWPRSCNTLVPLDVVPCLLESISPNASTRNDVALHSISMTGAILGYLIDGNHACSVAFLDQMDLHNIVGKLLGLCCSQDQGSMGVCVALDLLKRLTKASPRIFESIIQQHGPSIVSRSLRIHKRNPEVVKYGTLLLARWGALPGMADRLDSSGVFEALWEVISVHGYDSKTYAYAACGICMLSIDSVEKLCRMLIQEGTDAMASFCSAIEHYDECFEKHSIVHHTIWQAISSAYGSRMVLLAGRLGLLESLAKWDTNCELILSVIRSLIEAGHRFEDSDAMLASFLVKKMPHFPEDTVLALFSGNSRKNCFVETLVDQSFRHLAQQNAEYYKDFVEENEDNFSETDMLISEPSTDSLALLIEDNDAKGSLQQEVKNSNSKGLGDACFDAFARENVYIGSTVILCKVLGKLCPALVGRTDQTEEPRAKRLKSSFRDSDTTVMFRIGGTLISVSKEILLKESRVASLLLEDCNSEIEIPALHQLSTENIVVAFRRIFAWCQHGYISDDMTLEEVQHCWIAADYLDMSDEFMEYLFEHKVEPCLLMYRTDDRALVYTWLSSLCRMFLGSQSLYSWAARCVIHELRQAEMFHRRLPNLESLQDFAQLDGMSAAVTAHLKLGFTANV